MTESGTGYRSAISYDTRMDKPTLLKAVNPLLALSLLVQGLTGYFQEDVRGLNRVHEYNAVLLLLLALAHLALNWSWVRSAFLPRRAPGA